MNFYCASVAVGCLAVLLVSCNDRPTSASFIPTPKSGAVPVLVEDIDGNTYRTVQIGGQVWMAENLRTTRYRNGHDLPYSKTDESWSGEAVGMRCSYNHNESKADQFGQLYNWHAVNDARGLCPAGWHVPNDEEWTVMELSIGLSDKVAESENMRGGHGGSLKSETWNGTNSSGFSALPGGIRHSWGEFRDAGSDAYFWSSSLDNSSAWCRKLNSDFVGVVRRSNVQRNGFSVRCVRD